MITCDNCAISYEDCTIKKKTSRVGGIFRVGRVTPIQLFLEGALSLISIDFQKRMQKLALAYHERTDNDLHVYMIYKCPNYSHTIFLVHLTTILFHRFSLSVICHVLLGSFLIKVCIVL